MEALCKMDRRYDFLALTCRLERVLSDRVGCAQGIHDKPAFVWWVPYVLAKHK
jgi:hypothetical protein